MSEPSGARPSGDLGSLYPSLYGSEGGLEAVVDTVWRSTRDKAREVVTLRDRILERDHEALWSCAAAMAERFVAGSTLFTFGNGGSSTDAQDLAQTFLHAAGGRPLPAFALTGDVAVITALSNDIGFDVVFARQIAAFAVDGDIAVGISTSGNSVNLLRAFNEASRRGLLTVGLAGGDGGEMAGLDTIDHLFVVPSSSVHRIQETQTTIYHVLWELTHAALDDRTPAA